MCVINDGTTEQQASLTCEISQRFLALMTLRVLKNTGQVYRLSLYWNVPFFLMIRLELWFWGESSQRESAIFITSYQGHILSIRFMMVDVELDLISWLKQLYCFPLSMLCDLERSHFVEPTLKEWELYSNSLRLEYIHNLFGILRRRSVSPPFIYSVTYLYQYALMDMIFYLRL